MQCNVTACITNAYKALKIILSEKVYGKQFLYTDLYYIDGRECNLRGNVNELSIIWRCDLPGVVSRHIYEFQLRD